MLEFSVKLNWPFYETRVDIFTFFLEFLSEKKIQITILGINGEAFDIFVEFSNWR